MSINPTNAPADVQKFYNDAKKAFIGKSPWIIDQHQERTTHTNINRTVVTICDEDGFNSVTLQDSIKTPQDGGRISNVGVFAGAFGTTIEDVRFSEMSGFTRNHSAQSEIIKIQMIVCAAFYDILGEQPMLMLDHDSDNLSFRAEYNNSKMSVDIIGRYGVNQ